MRGRLPAFPLVAPLVCLVLALLQLGVFPRPLDDVPGKWFLYGRDTLAHDAVVHQWVLQWMGEDRGLVPLWMPELHGGLPTVGAFLWTPLAPGVVGFPFLVYPDAQRLGWLLSLWLAGVGGVVLGRCLGMRPMAALFTGMVWMLCGHVVTLIHAGHFQKVMALGWLPWMVAGAMLAVEAGGRRRLRGVALLAGGLGLILLSGHPQIAYTGMVLTAGWAAWVLAARRSRRRRWPFAVLAPVAGIAAGLALGGAQFLPGLEMSGWSNRAEGLSFEEAVATSYPPGEIAEFVVPRVKGSSVFGDVYTGDWGERIVSDYIGFPVVLLAAVGLVLAWRIRAHRAVFWAGVVVVSLVVAVGDHTPVYRLLFDRLPGFASFRSPGTFMCATSLALAVLAGMGIDGLLREGRRRRLPRLLPPVLFLVLFLGIALDLMRANRHFLFSFSWDRYRAEFLEPNAIDDWIQDRRFQLNVFDATSELSLRPILFGRPAVNGYHPITWAMKAERDGELGMYSKDWHQAWGVPMVIVHEEMQFDSGDLDFLERFPAQERMILRIRGITGHSHGQGIDRVSWRLRAPNERVAEVTGWASTLRMADAVAPGWVVHLDDELLKEIEEPDLSVTVSVPRGTSTLRFVYQPFSWRAGLWLSMMGALLACFCLGLSRRDSLE